jgi:hypothetical protein
MLFEKTIFDDRTPVKQKEFFEYASITLPLLINPEMTIKTWERTIEYINKIYDTGSLRNSDLER